MNTLDSINGSVFSAVNAPLHGRPARYIAPVQESLFPATTLGAAITSTSQTSVVLSFDPPTLQTPFLIMIVNEIMLVTSIIGGMATVLRAQCGTAAQINLIGQPVLYAGQQLNIVVSPDNWRSVFDTGSDDLDFNVIPADIGANDIETAPVEVGRGSTGDTIVFDDFPLKTWYVRSLGASAEYVGAYYSVVLADYNGPMNGV